MMDIQTEHASLEEHVGKPPERNLVCIGHSGNPLAMTGVEKLAAN